MSDYRTEIIKSQRRINQLSGKGASGGLFQAFVDASTGVSQSGRLVYAGGERNIGLPMPFESSTAWIRAIPEAGSPALAAYRSDTSEPVFINYINTNPKDKLSAYDSGNNIYRTLVPGEIEVNSKGMAQSFYGVRPIIDQRAGVVRSWLDADRLESGAKAPSHTRQLWTYKSSSLFPLPEVSLVFALTPSPVGPPVVLLGDEERFGVVRRPYNMLQDPTTGQPRSGVIATAALSAAASSAIAGASAALGSIPPNPTLALQLFKLAGTLATESAVDYSYNYFDYPFPDFTIPTSTGGAPNVSTLSGAQAATTAAGATAALAAGQLESRVFAKEYVRIINNPLFGLASDPNIAATNPSLVAATAAIANPKLIDIREGQVFGDNAVQTTGPHGGYLRAAYNYYTPTGDATSITVDEIGNIDWNLSLAANVGWNVNIPTGGVKILAVKDVSILTGLNIDLVSTTGTIGLDATTDVTLTAGAETAFTTGTDHTHTVVAGSHTTTVAGGDVTVSTDMAISMDAGTDVDITAATSMTLDAPKMSIGALASQSMVLGDFLNSFLTTLLTAIEGAELVGNLGDPVLLSSDPNFVEQLQALQNQLLPSSPEYPMSKTIKVAP